MNTSNPTVFMIGAGRVATALATGMRKSGAPILGIYSRTRESSRRASARSGVASYAAAPPDILLESDLVIVAVADDAVADVTGRLIDTGFIGAKHTLLHCSGARPGNEAFAAHRDKVAAVGTLHPLRAVTDDEASADWRHTVFGVEGDEQAVAMANSVVRVLGGQVLSLQGEQMAAYHTGASMASNMVAALLSASARLLAGVGIGESEAQRALAKLAQGSLAAVLEHGLPAGLTGPIRRGDVSTVEKHLAVVESDPQLAEMYVVLARELHSMAQNLGEAPTDRLDAIARLVGKDTS